MESEIIVLYYDKANENYHPILLNEVEEGAICAKISEIFAAKGYDSVLVDENKYKLIREEKKDSVKESNTGIIQQG